MEYIREDFDNKGVLEAMNPSFFGYHYGPIPNPNEGWLPERYILTRAENKIPAPVTLAENAGMICNLYEKQYTYRR